MYIHLSINEYFEGYLFILISDQIAHKSYNVLCIYVIKI